MIPFDLRVLSFFSGHVVDRDALMEAAAETFHCRLCRSLFRLYLWPHDSVVAECKCFCACFREG